MSSAVLVFEADAYATATTTIDKTSFTKGGRAKTAQNGGSRYKRNICVQSQSIRFQLEYPIQYLDCRNETMIKNGSNVTLDNYFSYSFFIEKTSVEWRADSRFPRHNQRQCKLSLNICYTVDGYALDDLVVAAKETRSIRYFDVIQIS